MSQTSNNVIKQKEQLRWFLNKLIALSKNPVTLQSYDENICFPVNLLKKEKTELFPLGRNASAVEYDSEDQEYASYCKEMLETIKRDIYKLENKNVHFNEEKFSWYEDPGLFCSDYSFFIDCYNKPLFESYLLFINRTKKDKRCSGVIEKMEILEDKSERGRINIYINGDYKHEPMSFSRNNRWGKMYELAKSQKVLFEKGFYDYFNVQSTNPLYNTRGFKITKILKEQDGYIVPNITIKLITQNKVTRLLKSA
jgi:hypothetical protein